MSTTEHYSPVALWFRGSDMGIKWCLYWLSNMSITELTGAVLAMYRINIY